MPKITIPASKSLVVVSSASGPVQAWDVTEPNPDAPEGAVGSPFEFVRHFVGQTLLADPSWGKSMDSVYQAQEIRGAFRSKQPGDVAELPKGHFDALHAVMKNPATGYSAVVMGCALDFFAALDKPTE